MFDGGHPILRSPSSYFIVTSFLQVILEEEHLAHPEHQRALSFGPSNQPLISSSSSLTIMADLALEDARQSPRSFGEIFLISILSKKWTLRWYLFHQWVNWGSEIRSCFHIVHLRGAEPRLSVRIWGFGATLCGNLPPRQCHPIPTLQEMTAVAEFPCCSTYPCCCIESTKHFILMTQNTKTIILLSVSTMA